MARVFVNDTTLTDIADAIREKNGTEDAYKPSQMADAVRGIVSGGSDESVWVEDDSPVIYVKGCYANTNVELHISENRTATFKRKYRAGEKNFYPNHFPQWSYSNTNQMPNTHLEFANLITSVEQAEVVNHENFTEEEKISKIGQNTFACMTSLKRCRIPDTIESIGNSVFYLCYKLGKIKLPNTVTSMGNNVFQYCTSLEEFDIPPLVTSLGSYVFSNCLSLKKITGIERMTSIGSCCFDACALLEGAIILNEAISELSASTFRNCYSIEKVIFLGTPSTIVGGVFTGCYKLKDIYVPWSEGEVANAPWGATNATIHYNTVYDENHNPIV